MVLKINEAAHKLKTDFDILKGLARENTLGQLASDALYTANQIVNTVHVNDPTSLETALAITKAFFDQRRDYGSTTHEITATGHCHIGSVLQSL